MATGKYEKKYYKDDGTVKGYDRYYCTTSGLALSNINLSPNLFDFLLNEDGVLGKVNTMLNILKCYQDKTDAYEADNKRDFIEAYNELQDDVNELTRSLGDLKQLLDNQVKDIENEIKEDYAWAYCATFRDESRGDRSE